MAIMAEFKTAYLQREVAVTADVTAEVKVGQVCTLAEDKITPVSTVGAVVNGDVIIAQSDMTVGRGHVPVENRSLSYSDKVAVGNDKHVMVFVITDVNDVILKSV